MGAASSTEAATGVAVMAGMMHTQSEVTMSTPTQQKSFPIECPMSAQAVTTSYSGACECPASPELRHSVYSETDVNPTNMVSYDEECTSQ